MKKLIFVLFLVIFLKYTQDISAQSTTKIDCKIWKTDNFCNIPDTLSFPKMHHSHFSYLPWKRCDEIQKMKNVTAVCITIPKNTYSRIIMNRGFKSVVLVSKDGRKVRPIGLLWNDLHSKNNTSDYGYITKIKAFKFEIDSDKDQEINIVLLFPIAQIGDIINFKKMFSAILEE